MILTPLVLTVYDRDGVQHGWLDATISATITPRWWATGSIDVTVPGSSPLIDVLRSDGARIAATYAGTPVVAGMVASYDGTVTATAATWTFHADDDYVLLSQIRARKDHTKTLAQQPATGVTWTGKTETVVKNVIAGSLAHAGYLIDVEPDQGRGVTTSIVGDFGALHETVLPALKAAGGDVTVTWNPVTGRYLIGYREGSQYPPILSLTDGSVAQLGISKAAPTANRVILSDGSTPPAYTSADVSSTQASYGRITETTRSGSTVAERSEQANEAANDGAVKTGLSIAFPGDQGRHFGGPQGMRVGDLVTVRYGDALIEDRLIEAPIVLEAGKGMRVTPNVGGWSNHPSRKLVEAVSRLDNRVRRLMMGG